MNGSLTYWRVHLLFTLPPTLACHLWLRPFITSRDRLRIAFLAVVAVAWTFPWDDYIIANKAWTYAPWAVTYTVSRVPVEEVAFFVIQSLLTCQLHLALSLPLSPARYLLPGDAHDLARRRPWTWRSLRWLPPIALLAAARTGWSHAIPATHPFYLSCIAFWALPVIALLWSLGGDYVMRRPAIYTLCGLLAPTIYLCFVDVVALRAGTWRIERPTSLGVEVWPDLPVEEAVFFLVTNALLVLGMSTFEKAYAILDLWPEVGLARTSGVRRPTASITARASPGYVGSLIRALTTDLGGITLSRRARVRALDACADLLRQSSRSFSLAGLAFPHGGGTGSRQDLTILYAWCRETDNMVDEAPDARAAREAVNTCTDFLDLVWGAASTKADGATHAEQPLPALSDFDLNRFLAQRVPPSRQAPFLLLAVLKQQLDLPRHPFDSLLRGYLWDVEQSSRPIETEANLREYAAHVAGSVGEMCVHALWARHGRRPSDPAFRAEVLSAAREAGICLQLVNVARDIKVDAANGRCYIPRSWIKDGLDPLASSSFLASHSRRLLDLAADRCDRPRFARAVATLPPGCQAGVRAALALYLEIGDELARRIAAGSANGSAHHKADGGKAGPEGEKVSVDKTRRIVVAVGEIWQVPFMGASRDGIFASPRRKKRA